MLSLANKHIILGITGGIAAYKSAELCRLLTRAGADVRVVMTRAGTEFITPLTMQALSGNRVHTDLLDEEAEAAMGHIELARWADLVLVAPASANFMARLNQGEAQDLLTTLCLATTAPIAIAPAMNQAMWSNKNTQDNLVSLRSKGIRVFGPDAGEQACGEEGMGRMLEPVAILDAAADLFETGELAGLAVTVTAGPTREAIDPVRFISNHSSGKMGYALARAAVEAGARVTLVSGPVALDPPPGVEFIAVESAQQMLDACLARPGDIFIAVAAVADYRPAERLEKKLKKSADEMSLALVRNPDILATIAALENRPFCVGFAAETDNLAQYALEKLAAKGLDLIFANHATDTFNLDTAAATAYWPKAEAHGEKAFEPGSKTNLARGMTSLIAHRYRDTQAG